MNKQKRINAIKRVIAHWKNDWKKLELFGGDYPSFFNTFNSTSCPLCNLYTTKSGSPECLKCPLPTLKEKTIMRRKNTPLGCRTSIHSAPWGRALSAYRIEDKKAFHAARWALIKRLQRRLKKLELEIQHENR